MSFLKRSAPKPADDDVHEVEQYEPRPPAGKAANLPPPPLVTVGGLSEARPEDDSTESAQS
jgi:hypothetical protein